MEYETNNDEPQTPKKEVKKKKTIKSSGGFYPNFAYQRRLPIENTRQRPILDPVITNKQLFKALGVVPDKDGKIQTPVSYDKLLEIGMFLKQRSEAWLTARRDIKRIEYTGNDTHKRKKIIGASNLAAYCGLWTHRAQSYFKGEKGKGDNKQFLSGVKGVEMSFDAAARTNMASGTCKEQDVANDAERHYLIECEENGVKPEWIGSDIGSIYIPVLPREYILRRDIEPTIMIVVSPDNLLRNIVNGIFITQEFKCPSTWSRTKNEHKYNYWCRGVYPKPPFYYMFQVMAQIVAIYVLTEGKQSSYWGEFICLAELHMRKWIVKLDWTLWDKMVHCMYWAQNYYAIDGNPIPDDNIDPFRSYKEYDSLLEYLGKFVNSLNEKDYYAHDSWVDPRFTMKYFDVKIDGEIVDGRLPRKGAILHCNAPNVPVHAAAHVDSDIIDTIGTTLSKVTSLGQGKYKHGYVWWKVEGEGWEGWIQSNYLYDPDSDSPDMNIYNNLSSELVGDDEKKKLNVSNEKQLTLYDSWKVEVLK